MVCFSRFYIKFPLEEEEKWTHFVLSRIYGLNPMDNDFEEKVEGDIKTVIFRVCCHIPLLSVFPQLKIESEIKTPVSSLITFAQLLIGDCCHSVKTDVGIIHENFHPCTPEELKELIKYLTIIDPILSKVLPISPSEYYVCPKELETVLLFQIDNGELKVSNLNPCATFDIDDGFYYCGDAKLQQTFQEWKDKGDITVPIFSPLIL